MRPRSKKRAALMRIYAKRVAVFLEEHPVCEFPLGCGRPSVDVHHTRGRFGFRLLAEDWWKASCRFHNDYAETETGHSLEIGWLVRIESVA